MDSLYIDQVYDANPFNSSTSIHSPYYCHLLNKDHDKTSISASKILTLLRYECKYVVIHIGKLYDNYKSTARYFNRIIQKASNKRKLLMENSANNYGGCFSQLCHLKNTIFPGIGFCLDTQHAFASGLLDFRCGWERDLSEIHQLLHIDLIHLNDSKVEYKSGIDRHEVLGEGYIWKGNMDNLHSLLDFCYENCINVVCETPDLAKDSQYVRDYFESLNKPMSHCS